MSEPVTLYRVGDPSIGEAWPARFRFNRSTGGLGTGVYAFREESAAKRNEGEEWTNDGVFEIPNAITSPVQPTTEDATESLVRLSRVMVLMVREVRAGEYTFDEARGGDFTYFNLTGGLFGDPQMGDFNDTPLRELLREAIWDTPELRAKYGYDQDEPRMDVIDAAEEAKRRVESSSEAWWQSSGVQPINVWLYPEFDGVAPLAGAGGNTGQYGCVVFKERVDECVGRETKSNETVSAEKLVSCWENYQP